MRILVTGSTGFMGSHLMEEFKGTKYTVLGLGRSKRNLISGMKYESIDLRDFKKTDKIISKFKPEVVYHLAAVSAESTGEHSPINMTTNGYNTFFNVITASIKTGKLKKFIYVSSAAVYGDIETPYHEGQQPKPKDIYAVSKYANELSLQILASVYKFKYVIIRPHNITGERQDPSDPTRNVVPMFMQLLRLGRQPKIYGNGSSKRCYTYVKDVTKALYKCLKVENKIINVGADRATSIKELYHEVVDVSGIKIDPEYLPPREHEVEINTVSHNVARKLFKIKDTSFETTITKTWKWVDKQPKKEFISKKKEINL